jgi:inhibitor of KinA
MIAAATSPRFLDAGEAALVVEFGAIVDPALNDRVIALDERLTSLAIPGILETLPTYRSLMIHYDPLVIDRETLIAKIRSIEPDLHLSRTPKNSWIIPCCYLPPFGEDLANVARATGLTEAQVIALHSGTPLRAYMYGFAPGFCYLGGLPPELSISRRPMPRAPHAANAVLLAGGLSLISTFSMPTGWWVIGQTPVRLFSPSRNPNFFIEIGDLVRFLPIDKDEFGSLEEHAAASDLIAKREILR